MLGLVQIVYDTIALASDTGAYFVLAYRPMTTKANEGCIYEEMFNFAFCIDRSLLMAGIQRNTALFYK